jgi:hypothetical protein
MAIGREAAIYRTSPLDVAVLSVVVLGGGHQDDRGTGYCDRRPGRVDRSPGGLGELAGAAGGFRTEPRRKSLDRKLMVSHDACAGRTITPAMPIQDCWTKPAVAPRNSTWNTAHENCRMRRIAVGAHRPGRINCPAFENR